MHAHSVLHALFSGSIVCFLFLVSCTTSDFLATLSFAPLPSRIFSFEILFGALPSKAD